MIRVFPAPRTPRQHSGPVALTPRPPVTTPGWSTPTLVGVQPFHFPVASTAVGSTLPMPAGTQAGDVAVAFIVGPYNGYLSNFTENARPMQALVWSLESAGDSRAFPGSMFGFSVLGFPYDTEAEGFVSVWRDAHVRLDLDFSQSTVGRPDEPGSYVQWPGVMGPNGNGFVSGRYGSTTWATFDPPYSDEVWPVHLTDDTREYSYSPAVTPEFDPLDPHSGRQPERMQGGLIMGVQASYYYWKYVRLTDVGIGEVVLADQQGFPVLANLTDPFPALNPLPSWPTWSPVSGMGLTNMTAVLSSRGPAAQDLFLYPWDRTITGFSPTFDLNSDPVFPRTQSHLIMNGFAYVWAYSFPLVDGVPPPRGTIEVVQASNRFYRLPQGRMT